MDKTIVLDDKEFLICQEINVDNIHYIYCIAIDGDEYTLLKENDGMVESVTDIDEFKKVMSMIAKENI